MLRAGYAERYITISNPTDYPVAVRISMEGEIAAWTTAEPDSFTLDGKGYAIIKITVQPPADVPNGIYNGNILIVASQPVAAPAGVMGVAVAAAVIASQSVEISDVEIARYKVEFVDLPDTEECRPIQFVVGIRNTGNVRMAPRFHIDILSQDVIVQSHDYTGAVVLPTKLDRFLVKVPYELPQFKCIPVGSYIAHFTAYADGAVMDERKIPFQIHERGTLTVAGDLVALGIPTNVTVWGVVRVEGKFKNTGKVPLMAKLIAEIYHEDRLVTTAESGEMEVVMGATEILTAYFSPSWPGEYKIMASVLFDGKATAPQEAIVSISLPPVVLYGVAAAIAIVLLSAIILRRRKRR
jgi:hypothetical protein